MNSVLGPILLENSKLQVLVSAAQGGRVASLLDRHTGVEFLTQAQQLPSEQFPCFDAEFRHGPCAGIEECLPTVGRSGNDTVIGPVPDHGDFWQLAWEATKLSEQQISLHATGFSRPLLFEKTLTLEDSALRIGYRVTNKGDEATSFLYACHPLLAIEEGDRVRLPPEVLSLGLYYSRQDRLGGPGAKVSWPGGDAEGSLDLVRSRETGFADMLYSGQLQRGICGLYRNVARQGLWLRFDAKKLPYLGLWLCYGGWPDQGDGPRQYAVALEPTSAPVNTLAEAQAAGLAKWLQPEESFAWEIVFEITAPGISLEQFQSLT